MNDKLRALGRRWPWFGRALDVQDRVGEINGGFAASAITISVFVAIFPLLLVAIAIIGFLASGDDQLPARIIDNLGLTGIDPSRIPRHVAAVMDGNGRWATQKGLKRTEGHGAGEEALFNTLDGAIELGLGWFTVYAFSTENWKRPTDEVRYLMGFNKGILDRHAEDLHARNVRIQFIGRRDWRVPRGVANRIDWATDLTKDNTGLTFTIAFNYGGRAEIVDAVKRLVADGVKADKIDEKAIRSRLYDPSMPDPELMVRTSGEFRISNYLLWELAYSELVFTDVLWPDFRQQHLADAIREYQARDRRFGGVRSG